MKGSNLGGEKQSGERKPHFVRKILVRGSLPHKLPARFLKAPLAQLAEQVTLNH
jgi:hypothetical protein